ncbi:3-deoxy-D-manno-octulosonic acid transferase [Cyanobium sp. NIES-981]|uniref:3-deoxy-D-manno-octulosonic acid transferase n=1 Tax=Cyanobium sp. NIES-981 TaxID=1851505 RepID=UPI00155F7DBC|nr:glycosyltransferase N-terminal domain-containing protein [Cyanobium sp. NIES-981]
MPSEGRARHRRLFEAGPVLALWLLQTLLTPAIAALLLVRLWQGKEDRRRLPERLGWSVRRRPPGRLLWLHAASVGELTALVPLLRALVEASRRRGVPPPAVLVTSVSRSSSRLAGRLLPEGVIHQCAPVDHWLAFALFRRHWRPDLGVLAEAELWPELVRSMPRLHLVNARMSERSFRRHRHLPWLAAWLYGRARLCWAQSAADADRLRRLGAPRVEAVGSTKRDADPPPADGAIVARLAPWLQGSRVLLLASSHPGEERRLLEAWPLLRQGLGPLTLLLVPRHPERAAEVLQEALRRGRTARVWTRLAQAGPDHRRIEVLVVDRLGAMGSWLAVADLVLMGGSLAAGDRPVGGHNPLEPIRAGRRVVCGPDMANFAGLTEELETSGWLHRLRSPEDLGPTLLELLRSEAPLPPPLVLSGPCSTIAPQLLDALLSPA